MCLCVQTLSADGLGEVYPNRNPLFLKYEYTISKNTMDVFNQVTKTVCTCVHKLSLEISH